MLRMQLAGEVLMNLGLCWLFKPLEVHGNAKDNQDEPTVVSSCPVRHLSLGFFSFHRWRASRAHTSCILEFLTPCIGSRLAGLVEGHNHLVKDTSSALSRRWAAISLRLSCVRA
eukprot:TRINITY_DN80588_c0_g1_i1.p2 TRINITY_DN80588_c0_g1~~TRINITY_DN80588_c0_g1_i1.p2  ORF type:complete len:114 (-),score=8.06 TRINITY_DN80588_c0_g1_i1:209-550(-)